MPHDTISCPNCGQVLKLRDPAQMQGRVRCPACRHPFVIGSAEPPPPSKPVVSTPPATTMPAEFPPVVESADGGLARMRSLRRRDRQRRSLFWALGVVLVAVVVGAYYALRVPLIPSKGEEAASLSTEKNSRPANVAPNEAAPRDDATEKAEIALTYFPVGVRMVLHLHPATLWRNDRQHNGLRKCVGPVSEWVARGVVGTTTFPPEQIEEVTFGVLLKGQGIAPEIVAKVRLAEETNGDELAKRFEGTVQPGQSGSPPTIHAADRVVTLVDPKTFIVGPLVLEREMSDAATVPNPTDRAIEDLLSRADGRRAFSLICRPDDLRLYREALAGPASAELIRSIIDWLDPLAVEGIAWSLDVSESFESQLLVRNRAEVRARELERTLRSKLDDLPRTVMTTVESMNPADEGRRRIIGRFPAMLKATALATRAETESRLILWETLLPERAAPNLALAALLTWDESRRPRTEVKAPSLASPQKPLTITERLQQPIAVDFRRTPLHEAIAYISTETGVSMEVDGDGLRQAGYTRNMPQTLQLGKVPAIECLAAILKPYDQMVVLIDEEKKSILVTVRAMAKSKGITPLDLSR